ncbi:MAG TPA: hypothetical protein DDZ89_03070 [Clostridiales bacterium]|nr:hypothetical protein [Clostridiales bacterium]
MKKREIRNILKQLVDIPLPDKEKVLSACSEPKMVELVQIRKLKLKPLVAISFVLVLLVLSVSAYTIAAQVREYNEAVIFFSEYDLPIGGLTRGEIRKVYRDIRTMTFNYDKTAQVIESAVGGYEIFQENPTAEDLKNLWNYKNGMLFVQERTNSPVSYKYYTVEKLNERLGFDVHDKSVFEKYEKNELVWQVEFRNFWIEDYVMNRDRIIVYGRLPTYSSAQKSYAWIACIDSDGTVLWETMLYNGFKSEYIGAVVPTDEKIAVFSRGDLRYLCLNELDPDGEVINFHKTDVGNYGIWNAAKLGGDYIVQLGSYMTGEYAKIIKVNSEGVIIDSFLYDSDDNYYYVRDMIEYNEHVYLSAYSVPAPDKGEKDADKNAGGRHDIAPILRYIFDNNRMDISKEELTKLVRDQFTAVLLVCDPISGTPKEFYSVKGSLGSKLTINDSQELSWDVESITETFFSPMTSSFTIGGASYVYRYVFDKNGTLLSQEKTGEVVNFRR